MIPNSTVNPELQTSPRFQALAERRDFLGLASMWSAIIALSVAVLGAIRLPMPSVFPESNSRVKLGPMNAFHNGGVTTVAEHRLWIFDTPGGLYAISAVCTHLGCIVSRQDEEQFFCPCHGSKFDSAGKVKQGPAPRPLIYLELTVSPDGQLVVDKQKEVARDVRLTA